ncbi:MAG: hypothetical protein WA003_15645 [Desulfuromonadaceae bacterium]
MDDLIKELRRLSVNGRTSMIRCIAMEAADEIERLRANEDAMLTHLAQVITERDDLRDRYGDKTGHIS